MRRLLQLLVTKFEMDFLSASQGNREPDYCGAAYLTRNNWFYATVPTV